MVAVLAFKYMYWHFVYVPGEITKAWMNFVWFSLNFFSVEQLARTYFAPWRGVRWKQSRGFSIREFLNIHVSNMISRALGAFVRTWLIVFGLVSMIIVLLSGVIIFVGWLALPLLMLLAIYGAINVIF
ncbi:MAG: hypothetical protein A2748_00870 [Candidatus Wildermuthbacteria bacterium RIFCSPHIGHO2_01_FULL_45_20]|uniref:Uncharacterized protein n=1 Tax=Candidatus Wildermuthbacteria bacterium RIFCSPHIGHO2_02_FULL_45_25 TaxID=1802450 RepID=A0A1G2R2F9_9BACT|nr:MAG: hypothetical protein A2748_00870 [Candidatus Wildermuthbacteria bacterium RIFCSPHIGHO2_01_FULL_45_20]OHA66432.1 MAG: hypothetical protein A3C04_01240 [Candidatus Wildermuthbacteria bacterium RIFCSPHIGHO2_02_FULL_45_25]